MNEEFQCPHCLSTDIKYFAYIRPGKDSYIYACIKCKDMKKKFEVQFETKNKIVRP